MTKEIDWAWAAGLYEGEGSISGNKPPFILSMTTTDRDVVLKFHEVLECGRINGPYFRPGRKPYWRWHCGDRAGMLRFEKRIVPHLHSRRKVQLQMALEYAHQSHKKGGISSCFDDIKEEK